MLNIIIDEKKCMTKNGEYIMQVAKRNGINIPGLCHSEAFEGISACRLCIVEIEERGKRKVVTSCNYPVKKEIKVFTHTDKIINMRKTLLMLIAARMKDTTPLKELLEEYGVEKEERFNITTDDNCIMCGLCVKACEALGSNAIGTSYRGVNKKITAPFEEPPENCIGCTSCANVCPTCAIDFYDKDGIRHIWNGEFKLIKCEICGDYYATEKQIQYIENKTGEIEQRHICEKCKKKETAKNFKEVFKDIGFSS